MRPGTARSPSRRAARGPSERRRCAGWRAPGDRSVPTRSRSAPSRGRGSRRPSARRGRSGSSSAGRAAKVSSDLRVDLDLLDAVELVLDGILDRDQRLVGRVDPGRASRRGSSTCPHPVGPVASTAPWLPVRPRSPAARGPRRCIPSCSSSRTSRPLSRIRSTADSPRITGSVATRMSMNRSSTVSPMRPSCGRSPLGDVEVGHDLDPRDQSGREPPRHGGRVDRDAVDPEADRRSPSLGSRWMSEVPRLTASAMMVWTSLTTGASSADSRSSITSAPAALRGSPRRPRAPTPRGWRADSDGLDILGGGDRRPDLVAGGHRDVVEAEHVRRVGGGDQERVGVHEGDRDRAEAPGLAALIRFAAPLSTWNRSGRRSRARFGLRARARAGGAEASRPRPAPRRSSAAARARRDPPARRVPIGEAERDDDVSEPPPLVRVAGRRRSRLPPESPKVRSFHH